MNTLPVMCLGALVLAADTLPTAAADSFPKQPPVPYLSVEEILKTFQIQDGYRLEPVLTEPVIKEPVAIAFAPAKAKFVRITQTGAVDGLFWSIHETQLLQPPIPLAAKPASKKAGNAFD